MGYVRSSLKLVFTDEEFAGLEVSCRRPTIGDLTQVRKLRNDADTDDGALDALYGILAGAITRWNVEDEVLDDDGRVVDVVAVKPDRDGVASRDIGMFMAVLNAWVDVVDVAPPLPRRSSSGGPSPGQFELMEALSNSPESLPTPA